MENRLHDNPPTTARTVWFRWLAVFGAVWVLLAIAYAILTIQSQRKLGNLIDDGVAQVEGLAETAGLPLLDQDINALHKMLKEMGGRPQVLYVSVVDHKNKIIAYTDAGRLLPERREKVSRFHGVDTWRDKGAMVFSKPIIFAQTPIGEVRLALSMTTVIQPMKRFSVIAASALIILIVLLSWVYGRVLFQRFADWLRGRRPDVDVHVLLCPLCGQAADSDARFFHSADMDNAPVFRISGNGANNGFGLRLSDIGTNPKLTSVRDQMIRQCAEIIKRLAVHDAGKVRQMRENQR